MQPSTASTYRRGGNALLTGPGIFTDQLHKLWKGQRLQRRSYGRLQLFLITAFLCWCFFLVRRQLQVWELEHTHSFCEMSQPAVQAHDRYVPPGYFNLLQTDTKAFIRERQNNSKFFNPEGFGKHLAFAYKFNDKGLESIRERQDIKYIYPLLCMLRNPKANAFTMRILVGLPGNGTEKVAKPHADAATYSDPARRAAGDYREYTVVPYTTTVLYLTVPDDMHGGDIELRDDNPQSPTHGKKWRISPTENLLVMFRGDIPHTVHGYSTKTGTWRISIVFQQLILPSRYYRLAEFMDDS